MKLTKEDIGEVLMIPNGHNNKELCYEFIRLDRLREVVKELKKKTIGIPQDYFNGEINKTVNDCVDELFGEVIE